MKCNVIDCSPPMNYSNNLGVNHVISIETDGRGRYLRGNNEVDLELLRKQKAEKNSNFGETCQICHGKSNGIHFG